MIHVNVNGPEMQMICDAIDEAGRIFTFLLTVVVSIVAGGMALAAVAYYAGRAIWRRLRSATWAGVITSVERKALR